MSGASGCPVRAAAMLPAPPLLPFRRLQRLSHLSRSSDVAIPHAGSGIHAVSALLHCCRFASPTCLALRRVSLPASGSPLTLPPACWLPVHGECIPSRRWSARSPLHAPLPSLDFHFVRRVACFARPQGVAPTVSPLHPASRSLRSARSSPGLHLFGGRGVRPARFLPKKARCPSE